MISLRGGRATLVLGDAATVLARQSARSVDMAYIDPPFGTGRLWKGSAGSFDDRWTDSPTSRAGWWALRQHNPAGARLLDLVAPDDQRRAYLGVMAGLVLAIHRALKLTGTLWLHHDDTAGAHLRVLGDAVFGPHLGIGALVWKRSSAHNFRKGFGRVHDTVAVWARSRATRMRLHRIGSIPDPLVLHHCGDMPLMGSVLETPPMSSSTKERLGYPTQKPVALLEEMIGLATLPDDLVLDGTCGSGTTLVAALKLGRRALGIDISPDAITVASRRLTDTIAVGRAA